MKTTSVCLGSLSGCLDAHSNESSPLFCKTACTPASYALRLCCILFFRYILLQNTWRTARKKEILFPFYLPIVSDATWNPALTLLFFAGIKVTTFSKGCLIRQSAGSRWALRLLSGLSLHHCLCWWDLSCLFWYSSNMFLFLSRYAPSLPRKEKKTKNNIFTEGGYAVLLPGRFFFFPHWQIPYITLRVLFCLLCFEGASTPLFMWTPSHTVTPAVWLYSTNTKILLYMMLHDLS